jgi:hypothetical protein
MCHKYSIKTFWRPTLNYDSSNRNKTNVQFKHDINHKDEYLLGELRHINHIVNLEKPR